jgi:DNA-binding response OmpR family regulator
MELSAQMRKPTGLSGRRVLLVDDDVELCQLISLYFENEGFAVEAVHTGQEGVGRALSGEHAIVVLDVMLPGMNGFEVLRCVRDQSRMPVLMLTARGDEQDRIRGLEMGADDYLPKPFNPRELFARIDAILRRSRNDLTEMKPGGAERIVVEDIELDKCGRMVRRAGEEVNLTTVEFDLLEEFLKSAGHVLPREQMVRSVLRREFSPFDRSIDTHVSNLRKKLGPTSDGLERIKGVRGIGYLYSLSRSSRGGEK